LADPSSSDRPRPTSHASSLGIAEAEAADLKLRVKESLEREKRLFARATRAEQRLEEALRNEHELRTQIERLTNFHRAVERSAPWRLIQLARGLLGRRW
jgi:hypothetical protein